MTEQPDETSEIVRAGMRTAMTLAAQLAQAAIRDREQRLEAERAASLQRAAELQARLDAERAAAVATLADVKRVQWWADAEPQQIADMYQVARTWEDLDPVAKEAAEKIRTQVQHDYGIEPAELLNADSLSRAADLERERARVDQATAVAIGSDAAADRAEHHGAETEFAAASEERADALWDSADRRIDTATSLEGVASADAVKGRMLADTGQGMRARAAVDQQAAKAVPAAAKAVTPGAAQQPRRAPGR
jgi:hypothetical protein